MNAFTACAPRLVVWFVLAHVAASCTDDQARTGSLQLTERMLADGTVGADYRETIAVEGSDAALARWQVASGQLPPGLVLEGETGAMTGIAGHPLVAGEYRFTLAATAGGARAQRDFAISVVDGLALQGLPAGAVEGQPFHQTLSAIGGRGQQFTWTVDDLPTGLTATPRGRLLTLGGLPPAGRFPVTISVRDDVGGMATRSSELWVISSLRIAGELPTGREEQAYAATLTVDGGTGTGYHWSLGSAAPGRLGLIEANGNSITLAGTPRAGRYVVPVAVTDDSGARTERTFALDVFAPLAITTTIVPNARIGEPYMATLVAEGDLDASLPHHWAIESGSLPPGISLLTGRGGTATPTGSASGPGTFRFPGAMATGAERATRTFEITVGDDPPTILATVLPTATLRQDYGAVLDASSPAGGTGRWRVVAGELPPGMSLADGAASRGLVLGTPRLAGSFTFTAELSDAGGSDTQELTLVVEKLEGLDIVTAVWPRGRVGESYAFSAKALGARGRVTWSIAGGELPPGLSLDEATGMVSGTVSDLPGAATFYRMTLRARDSAGRLADRQVGIGVNSDRAFVVATHSESFGGPHTVSVHPMSSGSIPELAAATEEIDGFAWVDAVSPGGTWATVQARDGTALYLVDLRPPVFPPRLLTTALRPDRSGPARFSADDDFVAWPIENPPGSHRFDWSITDLRGLVPEQREVILDSDYNATWAPDGIKLFVGSSDGRSFHVWDGGTLRSVPLPAPLQAFTTSWTPDSQSLIAMTTGDGRRLHLVPVDPLAGSMLPLPLTPASLFINGNLTQSSPDGRTVIASTAFAGVATPRQLTIDLSSRQVARAAPFTEGPVTVDWSPDSRELVLLRGLRAPDTTASLARLDRDQIGISAPTPIDLTRTGAPTEAGQWSSDSRYYGFTATAGLFQLSMRESSQPRLIADAQLRKQDWASLASLMSRPTHVVELGGLFLIDFVVLERTAIRLDAEAPAASWKVIPHSQAVLWTSLATSPHSLRWTTVSASTSASRPLLNFGNGTASFAVTP